MLTLSYLHDRLPKEHSSERTHIGSLVPYFDELLMSAPDVVVQFVMEDLDAYEQTGHASRTILRLVERAQCLADADRIETKFAA